MAITLSCPGCRSFTTAFFASLVFGGSAAGVLYYLATLPALQIKPVEPARLPTTCFLAGGVAFLMLFFPWQLAAAMGSTSATKKKKKNKQKKAKTQPAKSFKKSVDVDESDDSSDDEPKTAEAKRAIAKKNAREERQHLETLVAMRQGTYRATDKSGSSPTKKPPKGAIETSAIPSAPVAPRAAANKPAKKQKAPTTDIDDGEWTTTKSNKKDKTAKPKQTETAQTASEGKEEQTSLQLPVPARFYGIIIGDKGANLNRLQDGTGAKIEIPKKELQEKGAKEAVIIRGTAVQVQRAKAAIEMLMQKGYSKYTHPDACEGNVHVPSKALGIVIGPQGAHIKAIQQKTGVKVITPDRSSNSERVTLLGTKEGIKRAKAAIKQLVTDGFSPLTHEGYIVEELAVPRHRFPVIIGPRGQTIKSIQGDTKASIKIPDVMDDNQNVRVIGSQAAVARAVKQVQKALERYDEEQAGGKAPQRHQAEDEEEDEPYYDEDTSF